MDNQSFAYRHIGPKESNLQEMLETIGASSMDQLIDQTVPNSIRLENELDLPPALSEYGFLEHIRDLADQNELYKTYIGQGYHGTILPGPIQRNILENPGWYTAYTPYQAEIAQGRLEALLNYQTTIVELTGMELANASLLDESTAAAEAMSMFFAARPKDKKQSTRFFASRFVHPQTLDVLKTRTKPIGVELVIGDLDEVLFDDSFFGCLVQYPDTYGNIRDLRDFTSRAREHGIQVAVAADLMSLVLLTPPGEWGADCVVGTSQRFGIPLGYGGPHAAFFATHESYKRLIPGRIIGQTVDKDGRPALRMALQTREQHIKRDRATSNICTAQVLLSVMAGMYAVYHGPEGLKRIAWRIHHHARELNERLKAFGIEQLNENYFDTLRLQLNKGQQQQVLLATEEAKINLRYFHNGDVGITVDETTSSEDVDAIAEVLATALKVEMPSEFERWEKPALGPQLRTSIFLSQDVFNRYHSETELMRYIKMLERKDLSLNHSMIPLGSWTMKLNAAVEMIPLTWPKFANIHPFVPIEQATGYQQIIAELESHLAVITGFEAVSLQPNSGAQGEYAGLMVIRAYHHSRGQDQRHIVLIPSSAHGTNPASGVMAGMKVVVVKCDEAGNIDVDDLREKAEKHSDELAALMVTYPSTHGVFETRIKEITSIVHEHGGQVYMDGANMNAQVGLTSPGEIGADVCHLNLHKTFAIPHGGGGPGMGPICVASHLAAFLPGNVAISTGGNQGITGISGAPWGSGLILIISYAYIRMLGTEGLRASTEYAILNANYLEARLKDHYSVLYKGEKGRVAHEMILDCRPFKKLGIEVTDIAKRLMDYGYHAPTVSFPVAGTLMVEPTESESKSELDRFCEAMISIRKEIDQLALGEFKEDDNPLNNAPHTLEMISSDTWSHAYSRQVAAFPLDYLSENKFWPSVRRVDDAYGDRNLVCTCEPIEAYLD
jgi:glycine dehydrogenase